MPVSLTRGWLPRVMLGASLLCAVHPAAAEVAVPPLKARVTDLSSTLSQDQRAALEQKLAALEARKGSQIAVLLVPTTQPEAVEQYAIRVFDQWKLGRKGVDDGVLLLVAKNDRKLRIEVGRGLEGAIPDAFAKRIIEEEITPRFKQGDFNGGISAGVDRIARLVDGETMPAPKRAAQSGRHWDPDLLFYGFIAVMLLGGLLRAIFGRFLGSGIVGFAAGVVTYILFGVVAALIVAIVAMLLNLFNQGGSGRGWSSGGGNWSSGGGSRSSGGGGFSGGGGSSGGGGASGSW
jgi:uncharacterized protein